MSLMHGKLGRIEWDASATRQNLVLGQSWTLDITHDVAETTSMQDAWKTYAGGFRDWNATVECLEPTTGSSVAWANGNPNGFADVKAYLELYLVYDTGSYKMLYGEAICTGIAPKSGSQAVNTITYTFKGTGQMTWYSGATLKTY